jgi:hypothetical protein
MQSIVAKGSTGILMSQTRSNQKCHMYQLLFRCSNRSYASTCISIGESKRRMTVPFWQHIITSSQAVSRKDHFIYTHTSINPIIRKIGPIDEIYFDRLREKVLACNCCQIFRWADLNIVIGVWLQVPSTAVTTASFKLQVLCAPFT